MSDKLDALRKYKIGVLAGGDSSEREISLKSGNAVYQALKAKGLAVDLVDVREPGFDSLMDISGIDVAFIALHGKFGEDGTVQTILQKKGIPYTGSGPESSRTALDKYASKLKFEAAGISVPGYRMFPPGAKDIDIGDIGFPCVVKPRYEGSSVGLSIVSENKDLKAAFEKAAKCGGDVIIEKFIHGKELTVGIMGKIALPVVEIVPAGGVYDYVAKYSSKDTVYEVPAKLGKKDYEASQKCGLAAHRALGCRGFSRVDIRLSESGEPFVLEVNTIPGLTERSLLPMAARAAGLDFPELCVSMLYGAFAQ